MRGDKAHSGVMVALMLPDDAVAALTEAVGDTLALDEGLHVTLAFLGQAADLSDVRPAVKAALAAFAPTQPPVSGTMNGLGRFNPSDGSDGKAPLYVNFDAPVLVDFRAALVDALAAAGVTPVSNHGFTPHITLAYLPADAPLPDLRLPTTAVTFDRLTLAWGDARTEYALRKAEEEPSMSKQQGKPAEANEKKSLRLYEQAEVAYTPVSMTPGVACANCRWFDTYSNEYGGQQDRCYIIQNWPDAIEPTGWCSHHELAKPYTPEPMPVVVVEESEDTSEDERALSKDPGVLRKALKTVLALFGTNDGGLELGLKVEGNEWFGIWSNNFQDREHELFDHTGQDAYVEAVNAGELAMPTLKFWHIDHSTHGIATHVGRAGHFMWAKGIFTDDALGQAFRELYRKSKTPWRMSHGFAYPRRMLVDGVYKMFVTDEITTLPPMAAANFETWFIGGEKLVEVTKEQREALVAAVGDKGNQIADMLNDRGRQLREAGVSFKGLPPLEDAEARKDIDRIDGGQRAMAEAVTTMATSMKTLADTQTGQAGEIKSQGDRLTAIESNVKEIREALSMAPRATQNPATVVDEADPQLKLLKEKNRLNGKKSILEQIAAGETPLPADAQPASE